MNRVRLLDFGLDGGIAGLSDMSSGKGTPGRGEEGDAP